MELNERVDIRSGYFCVLEVEQKLEAAEGGEGQKGGDQRSSRVKRILRPQTAVLLPQARELASHRRADATHCAFQAGGLGLQRSPEVPGEWANPWAGNAAAAAPHSLQQNQREIDRGRVSLSAAGNPSPDFKSTTTPIDHSAVWSLGQNGRAECQQENAMRGRESAMGQSEKQTIGEQASHHGERRHGVEKHLGGILGTLCAEQGPGSGGRHWALRTPADRTVQNCTAKGATRGEHDATDVAAALNQPRPQPEISADALTAGPSSPVSTRLSHLIEAQHGR
ncbi:hypothetical protein FDECE_17517 [Fusarium decemcellulare]|nr:hypothetical protein FDECE_17517 [Fusarium decemcellulare]